MGPHHSSVCMVTSGLGAAQMFEAIMKFLSDDDMILFILFYRNFIKSTHVCPPIVDLFSQIMECTINSGRLATRKLNGNLEHSSMAKIIPRI